MFTLAVDASAVTIALPDIGRGLHISLAALQAVVVAYSLPFAGFALIGGGLADKYGRRRVLLSGLLVFGFASLAAAFAASVRVLDVSRVAAGLASGAVAPSSLGLLTAHFPAGQARDRAIAAQGAAIAGGFLGGACLSGVLIATVGWRAIFLVSATLGAILIALTVSVTSADAPSGGALPVRRTAVIAVAVALLYAGLELLTSRPARWLSAAAAIVVALALASAAIRGGVKRAQPRRRSRTLVFLLLVTASTYAVGTSVLIGMTVLLQDGLGLSAFTVGLAFCAPGLASLVAASSTAWCARAVGPVKTLVAGLAAQATGALAVGGVVVGAGVRLSVLGGALDGAGIGCVATLTALLLTRELPSAHHGTLGGVRMATMQVGDAMGAVVFSLFATTSPGLPASAHKLSSGLRDAMAVCAAILAIAACAALCVRGPLRRSSYAPHR